VFHEISTCDRLHFHPPASTCIKFNGSDSLTNKMLLVIKSCLGSSD